jgi:hypothetical protein
MLQPAEPVASGLQSSFVPPPPAIKARLQDYLNCQVTRQQLPQYAGLRNRFFFTGGPPVAGSLDAAVPGDEEQVALAKWEVDRKACVIALAEYIEFFAPFDKTQRVLFTTFENSVRTIHDTLIKGQLTWGAALGQIRQAEKAFWGTLAERNKDLRDSIVEGWFQGHATP